MFTSLPIDCWTGILDFLGPGDVLSLSAVSRDFYSSNLPFLYREISWEWDAVPLTRILRLLRTILQKPELASLIKDVTLKSPQQNVDRNRWKDSVKSEVRWKEEAANHLDVVKSAQDLIKEAEFPESSKWTDALQDGNAYAFAAILLSQLRNLANLQLDYSFVWKAGFPGLMLKHALFTAPEGLLSKFEYLTTVDYGSNVPLSEECDPMFNSWDIDGYPPCEPKQFMAWFHLPSIQSLSIWLRTFQDVLTPCYPMGNFNNIHTLVLARATMQEENVTDLLVQMHALKKLHLGMAYHWGQEQALENEFFILKGLDSVSHTIEKLSLGLEYYPFARSLYPFSDIADGFPREEFQGFLKQFPRLWSAEVPVTLLIGLDPFNNASKITSLLPNTLEELCLQWDNAEMSCSSWDSETQLHDCVRHLLTGLRSHSPKLKRITIRERWWTYGPNAFAAERAKLQEDCTEAGINLQMVFDYLSPGLWTCN